MCHAKTRNYSANESISALSDDTTSTTRNGKGNESLFGGIVLIGIGVLVLLQHFFGFVGIGFAWPFFIIGPGLLLFTLFLMGGRPASSLAIPATIVTTVGCILLFQSTFDYFQSWAYMWALLPAAGGVGTLLAGLQSNQPKLVRVGQKTALMGIATFGAFAAFFELFIYRNWLLAGYGWTIALILVGAYLVFNWLQERGDKSPYDLPPDDDISSKNEGQVFPY